MEPDRSEFDPVCYWLGYPAGYLLCFLIFETEYLTAALKIVRIKEDNMCIMFNT